MSWSRFKSQTFLFDLCSREKQTNGMPQKEYKTRAELVFFGKMGASDLHYKG